MRIYKVTLAVTDVQDIALPYDATILCVANQNEKLCLWYSFNDDTQQKIVTVYVVGTGNEFHETAKYFGTVSIGLYVWHVFMNGVVK